MARKKTRRKTTKRKLLKKEKKGSLSLLEIENGEKR